MGIFEEFKRKLRFAKWNRISQEYFQDEQGVWRDQKIKDEWNDNPLFFAKEGDVYDDYKIVNGKWQKI